MSHTVSGLIRRSPHIKQGQNANGQYTMFAFELSEFNKGYQNNPDTYTNYSVVLFAKTQGSVDFHNKAIAENSFVVVNADKLVVDQQVGNDGKEYIKLKMMNASLTGFNNPNQQQGQQQSQQRNNQQQQQAPQATNQGYQQQGQQQPPPAQAATQRQDQGFNQAPAQGQPSPMAEPDFNFDDDIPF